MNGFSADLLAIVTDYVADAVAKSNRRSTPIPSDSTSEIEKLKQDGFVAVMYLGTTDPTGSSGTVMYAPAAPSAFSLDDLLNNALGAFGLVDTEALLNALNPGALAELEETTTVEETTTMAPTTEVPTTTEPTTNTTEETTNEVTTGETTTEPATEPTTAEPTTAKPPETTAALPPEPETTTKPEAPPEEEPGTVAPPQEPDTQAQIPPAPAQESEE